MRFREEPLASCVESPNGRSRASTAQSCVGHRPLARIDRARTGRPAGQRDAKRARWRGNLSRRAGCQQSVRPDQTGRPGVVPRPRARRRSRRRPRPRGDRPSGEMSRPVLAAGICRPNADRPHTDQRVRVVPTRRAHPGRLTRYRPEIWTVTSWWIAANVLSLLG